MPRVQVPEYKTFIDFPDDMKPEEMQSVLSQHFPQKSTTMKKVKGFAKDAASTWKMGLDILKQNPEKALDAFTQPFSETIGLSPKEAYDPNKGYLPNVMAGLRNTGKSVINAAALPAQFPAQVTRSLVGEPLRKSLEGTQPLGSGIVQAGKSEAKGFVDMIKSGLPGLDPKWAETLFENPDTVVFGKLLARDVARGTIRKASDAIKRVQDYRTGKVPPLEVPSSTIETPTESFLKTPEVKVKAIKPQQPDMMGTGFSTIGEGKISTKELPKTPLEQGAEAEQTRAAQEGQLDFIKSRVAASEAGKRTMNQETGEPLVYGSSFPEWFKNKGYRKDEVIRVMDKAQNWDKLTSRQQDILDDLVEASKGEFDIAQKWAAGPGAQTDPAITGVRETPSDIEQMRQGLEGMKTVKGEIPKPGITDKITQKVNDYAEKTKGLIFSTKYRIGKLLGPPEHTDFKGILGDYLFQRQRTSKEAADFAKDIQKTIPEPRREAIVNWIDTGGNEALLRDAEQMTADKYKAGYRAALTLTEDEKRFAQNTSYYFQSKLQAAHDAGVPIGDVGENYINRIVEKDIPQAQKLRAQINAGVFQKNPGILRQRIHETLLEGERSGVKYVKDVGRSLVAYDQAINDAIETRKMLKGYIESGTAKDGRPLATVIGGTSPMTEAASGETTGVTVKPRMTAEDAYDYESVGHPAFRQWKWIGSDTAGKPILMEGEVKLHPEIAQHIKNIVSKSAIRKYAVGRIALGTVRELKATLLSLSAFHQVQVAKHGLDHWINPANAPEIDFENPVTQRLIKNGMMISDHDARQMFEEGSGGAGLVGRLPGVGPKLKEYTNYLFSDYIPRLKNKLGQVAIERNMERYGKKLSEDQVYEITANQVNAAFGELNYKWLGRSATVQDIARLALLAPDFLEARLRFAGQAVKPYGREQTYALLRDALGMYVGARALNYIINNGNTHDDKPFAVVYDGKQYSLRSVVGDMYHLLTDWRSFVYHRLNPYTTRTVIEGLTGKDQFGRNRATAQQIKDIAKNIIPIPGQGLVNKGAGQGLIDSVLAATGISSYQYKSDAEAKAQQLIGARSGGTYDEEKSATKKEAVEGMRKGSTDELRKAAQSGDVSKRQIKEWSKEGHMTPLQAAFQHTTWREAKEVWDKTTDEEKQAIFPQMRKKLNSAYSNASPNDKEEILKVVEEIKASMQPKQPAFQYRNREPDIPGEEEQNEYLKRLDEFLDRYDHQPAKVKKWETIP